MDPQTIPDTAAAAGAEVALGALLRDDAANALARRLGSAARTTVRASESVLPLLLAALHALRADTDRPALSILVEDDDAARELAEAIVAFRPETPVGYLPHRGAAWGSPLIPPPHLVGERARALDVLAAGGIVAVSAEALVERIGGRDSRTAPVRVGVGDLIERDDLIAALVESGYERVGGTVDERGQVSARGDVVDVFPTTGREPIRIELFGDEIERVSAFSSLTQRSLRDLGHVAVYPAQELLDVDGAASFADSDDGLEIPPGLVSLAPELLAAGALIAWEPRLVAAAAEERLTEVATPASRRRGYLRLEDVRELVDGLHAFDALPQGQAVAFEGQRPAIAARGIAETENELRAQVRGGQRVLIAFPHRGEAERTAMQLKRVETELLDPGATLPTAPGVYLVVSRLRRGLVSTAARAVGAAVGAAVPPQGRRRPHRSRRAVLHRPAARRLRRARGPRRRPLRRVRHQDGGGRDPRLPVPRLQGRGQAVRAARADREGVAVHRLRRPRARAVQARRQGLAHAEGPRAARRARAGRRAARPVRRPPGVREAADRGRRRPARRGGARLRLHRDRRPGARDRGRQGRPRVAPADGPARLRRRRLRQDRGRDPGRGADRRSRAARC